MSLEYERKKYKILKGKVEDYKKELEQNREIALDMPIETDNGFNTERERLLDEIDEKREILKRHGSSPYFAKLNFVDKDDGQQFNGYIGRLSIGEINDPSDEKIVDWRAPISDLYYNGRVGISNYSALGKEYTVDLKLKRQIKIKDDIVESIFDFNDAVSNDEFLAPFLTQSADNRLKNIVSTIQEEQNKIIRLPLHQNCIVQGVAGSGKTTVALHRLSYLMYNYKKSIFPEQFLILSPNEIFTSYISNILVDLEAEKANSFSLNKFVEMAIGEGYRILNKHEQYRKLTILNTPTDYLLFKNTRHFAQIIDNYFQDLIKKTFHKPLVINKIQVLDADSVYSYFKDYSYHKFEKIAELGSKRLGIEILTNEKLQLSMLHNVDMADKEFIQKVYAKRIIQSGNYGFIKKMFNTKIDIMKIYIDLITNLHNYTDFKNIDQLKKYTLKNIKQKILAYDDLAPILYLLSKFQDFPYFLKLKSVFIDEAQDLSELMYIAIRKLMPNAVFSIFGDIAQGIYSYQSIKTWEQILPIINTDKILPLTRSYRTSIEIMEEANKTLTKLGFIPSNNVIRHGEQVEYNKSNDCQLIANQLQQLNTKYANTAIICKDDTELNLAQQQLKDLHLTVLDENNFNYNNIQNSLLTVQTAKGLEFDSVIIYNAKNYTDSDLDQKLLYVAKTRALHKLIINGSK